MTKELHVRIPATSANLGSGFDAIGLALNLYNDMYFTEDPAADTIAIEVEGEGVGEISTDFDENLVGKSMRAAAVRNQRALPQGGRLRLVNRIPTSRGLGSSSVAIVGGILIGNQLTGGGLSRQDILTLATLIEGHPDNVAPAICGGLAVSVLADGKTLTNSIPIEEGLSFITVSPEIYVSTDMARKALPKTIAYQSAVFNVSRVSYLVSSFIMKRYDTLQYGLEDRLHVPYRLKLIPGGAAVLQAALAAGAAGATISGSGSTLIAFATGCEAAIKDAMIGAFAAQGIRAVGHILKCDNTGAVIL